MGRKTECNKPGLTGKRIADVIITFHMALQSKQILKLQD